VKTFINWILSRVLKPTDSLFVHVVVIFQNNEQFNTAKPSASASSHLRYRGIALWKELIAQAKPLTIENVKSLWSIYAPSNVTMDGDGSLISKPLLFFHAVTVTSLSFCLDIITIRPALHARRSLPSCFASITRLSRISQFDSSSLA
jgi:hypothetical protein